MTKNKHKKAKVIVPILVILLGILTMMVFIKSRPEPKRVPVKEASVLVRTQKASKESHPVFIQAQGEVIPSKRTTLQPEVSGKVIWQSESLIPGGVFPKNAKILRIDPKDYQFQVQARKADVSRAELEYKLEQGRGEIAKNEWQKFSSVERKQKSESREAIALREPQLAAAKDALQAAKSALKKAKLDLSRTTLKAPFYSVVLSEQVEEGQLISPQTPALTLAGAETFWVQLSIPSSKLGALSLNGLNITDSIDADIFYAVGGNKIERQGKVIKILSNLDPVGRMARVLVEIEDPLSIKISTSKEGKDLSPKPPLLLGSFVDVVIQSPTMIDAFKIPRSALHDGDHIWVVDEQSRLEIRDVNVSWRQEDFVLVEGGLKVGEQIVISQIPSPVTGMKLRVVSGQALENP